MWWCGSGEKRFAQGVFTGYASDEKYNGLASINAMNCDGRLNQRDDCSVRCWECRPLENTCRSNSLSRNSKGSFLFTTWVHLKYKLWLHFATLKVWDHFTFPWLQMGSKLVTPKCRKSTRIFSPYGVILSSRPVLLHFNCARARIVCILRHTIIFSGRLAVRGRLARARHSRSWATRNDSEQFDHDNEPMPCCRLQHMIIVTSRRLQKLIHESLHAWQGEGGGRREIFELGGPRKAK